jgi:hypothetical protein
MMRDGVADMVAAIQPGGNACLMKEADGTAPVAVAFDSLGDTDGSYQSSVAKSA